jgi:hypothetical protein
MCWAGCWTEWRWKHGAGFVRWVFIGVVSALILKPV